MFSRVVLRPQLKDLAEDDDKDDCDDEYEEEQDDGLLSPFSWDKRDMRVDNFPLMDSLLLPFGMLYRAEKIRLLAF